MKDMLKLCDLGLRIVLCQRGQDHVKKFGGKPFYCDDCRFETTVPKLVTMYGQHDGVTVAEMLQAFGMSAEADRLLSRKPADPPGDFDGGLCSYTQIPILSPCADTKCPLHIPAEWADNCLNKFRSLTNLNETLAPEHLATAFKSSRRRIQAVLREVTCSAREELLRDVVEDGTYNHMHPEWVRSIEQRFERPIEKVLSVLSVDQLVDGYGLQEAQRQYLNQISDSSE